MIYRRKFVLHSIILVAMVTKTISKVKSNVRQIVPKMLVSWHWLTAWHYQWHLIISSCVCFVIFIIIIKDYSSFVIHSWISLIFFFIICWNIIDSDFIMFIYCLIYLEYRLSKMVLECTKVFLIWHIIMMEKAVTYLSHHHCCKFQIFYRKNASYGAANVLVFNFSWTLVWIFVGFSHYSTQFLLVTFYTSYGRLSISLSYIVYIVNYISYISYIFLSNICS